MALRAEKRAFLVAVLGEDRVRQLEKRLPRAEKALEKLGIGWKEASCMMEGMGCPPGVAAGYADQPEEPSMVAVATVPVGPTTFSELEAEEEAREDGYEVEALTGTLNLLIDNIMTAPDLEAQDKQAKLNQAVGDFQVRLGSIGEKAMMGSSPAAPYVDLLGTAGATSLGGEAAQAVKELEGSGQPAAGIVAAFLHRGGVQGR